MDHVFIIRVYDVFFIGEKGIFFQQMSFSKKLGKPEIIQMGKEMEE